MSQCPAAGLLRVFMDKLHASLRANTLIFYPLHTTPLSITKEVERQHISQGRTTTLYVSFLESCRKANETEKLLHLCLTECKFELAETPSCRVYATAWRWSWNGLEFVLERSNLPKSKRCFSPLSLWSWLIHRGFLRNRRCAVIEKINNYFGAAPPLPCKKKAFSAVQSKKRRSFHQTKNCRCLLHLNVNQPWINL